jgi:hypothetical protein
MQNFIIFEVEVVVCKGAACAAYGRSSRASILRRRRGKRRACVVVRGLCRMCEGMQKNVSMGSDDGRGKAATGKAVRAR